MIRFLTEDDVAATLDMATTIDLLESAARALDASLACARSQLRRLPDPARNTMMLSAVVAYYATAPGAESEAAAEDIYTADLSSDHGVIGLSIVGRVAAIGDISADGIAGLKAE